MKSQRTFEVRSRAAVVVAIKRAAETAGINIPEDTTISFAETPLILERDADATKSGARSKPRKARATPKPQTTKTPSKTQAKAQAETQAELAKPADTKLDPEAEVPKQGELNEAADEVPR
jgi:hypothetical protein